MSTATSDRGGGLPVGNLFVLFFVIFAGLIAPAILLFPFIVDAFEAARRNGCMNSLRSLAIAVENHESAQKRLPTASNGSTDLLMAQTAGGNGKVSAASDDGFSWLYQIQPYSQCSPLYKEMKNSLARDVVQTGPFDRDFVDENGAHFALRDDPLLRCPSYSGPVITSVGGASAAVSNYYAMVGTDLSEGAMATWKTTNNWENGGLPSACWATLDSQTTALTLGSCIDRGIRLKNIGDGLSKTIIATESREPQFNAWLSGASMWVVAATPNSLQADRVNLGRLTSVDNFIGMLQMGSSVTEDGLGLALKSGSEAAAPPAADCYLQASQWATGASRVWGPSSEHAGNVVIHVFADGNARAISAEVNPTVYLRFITRSDGDPGNDCY